MLRALFTRPAAIVPHDRPSIDEISVLVGSAQVRRDSKPRRLTFMRAFSIGGRSWVAGFGEIVIIEGAVMPGHSLLVCVDVEWFEDFEKTVERVERLRLAARADSLGSLPFGGMFLAVEGNRSREWKLSGKLRAELVSLAAAYGVELVCLPEPGGRLAASIAEVHRNPPDALYIWRNRPCSTRKMKDATRELEDAFREARPRGLVFDLSEDSAEDMRVEIGWALGKQAGISGHQGLGSGDETSAEPVASWARVKARLVELESEAFVVRASALDCCKRNKYLHANRMLKYLEVLAGAAEEFRVIGGTACRFEDWIRETFGLDVALFDDNQPGETFEMDGVSYNDLPHVKVDDAKPLNECGRIHFAIDGSKRRLIVTYFGIHR
jgi:hypothetical protein